MPFDLTAARLYAICDLGYVAAADAVAASRQLLSGGADLLQLRAKGHPPESLEALARQLQKLCREAGVPFIINDHLELARAIAADGLHLGQDDGDLAAARARLAPGTLLGRSTHSLAQARAALAEGADYLGFGPLFPTATKPGRPAIGMQALAPMRAEVGAFAPVFCIGGVNRRTLPQVLAHGATRACIVSDLLLAGDREAATRAAKAMLSGA